MRTMRFGVIGGGLMGREFASAAARWLHLLEPISKPEIVAVADPSAEARAWFEGHHALRLSTPDFREVVSHPEVDALYIAVPHDLHEEVLCHAIPSGKAILAEKPFGIDLAANQAIMDCLAAHPETFVRCSSEFPFYPGAQRIVRLAHEGAFGKIIQVHAGFRHSSDLDPLKPINWKRQRARNGEYGCMGDLGLHVVHLPFRLGWLPLDVRAVLSNIVPERPDGKGATAPCDTWDNALLVCDGTDGQQNFPMILETKRIAPGETNTWFIEVQGTRTSVRYSTKHPKTLETLRYEPGTPQEWRTEDLGYASAHKTISGGIFEFGFSDALLQMWAAFMVEASGSQPPFGCAKPEEARMSHRLFTAALESHADKSVVRV